MRSKWWMVAGVMGCAVTAGWAGAEPPKPAAVVGEQPKVAGPWDTEADAGQQIAAALKKAKKNNTRVLLEWGGNTYAKSVAFHRQLTSEESIKKTILYEYEHVLIDYGQPMGKNVPLSKQFNADVNGDGVPYLTVLDLEGRMFANQPIGVFETSSGGKLSWDSAAVVKFLEANKATRVAASTVLEKGLTAAKSQKKRVILHFGAPWCGWCHRLEDWLARADVAPVLAKDFVDVKIDTDRNPGGQAMLDRYAGGEGKSGGIPWFVILDGEGKAIADSFAEPGAENIGFPAAEDEAAHFGKVLEKAAKSITAEEREKLLATLKEKKQQEDGK